MRPAKPKRVALSTFWETIEDELDALLGGHRLDDARRMHGADVPPAVDVEGSQWFGDLPRE